MLKEIVVLTAYCLGPCRVCKTTGLTYKQTRSSRGIATVGKRFKLGSRWAIPFYGIAKIDDRGGRVGRFDLRFRTHKEAVRFARRLKKRRLRVRQLK